jgi:hypothetical protein
VDAAGAGAGPVTAAVGCMACQVMTWISLSMSVPVVSGVYVAMVVIGNGKGGMGGGSVKKVVGADV